MNCLLAAGLIHSDLAANVTFSILSLVDNPICCEQTCTSHGLLSGLQSVSRSNATKCVLSSIAQTPGVRL